MRISSHLLASSTNPDPLCFPSVVAEAKDRPLVAIGGYSKSHVFVFSLLLVPHTSPYYLPVHELTDEFIDERTFDPLVPLFSVADDLFPSQTLEDVISSFELSGRTLRRPSTEEFTTIQTPPTTSSVRLPLPLSFPLTFTDLLALLFHHLAMMRVGILEGGMEVEHLKSSFETSSINPDRKPPIAPAAQPQATIHDPETLHLSPSERLRIDQVHAEKRKSKADRTGTLKGATSARSGI